VAFFGQFRPNSGAAVVERVDEEDESHEYHVDHAQISLLCSVFVKNAHITDVQYAQLGIHTTVNHGRPQEGSERGLGTKFPQRFPPVVDDGL